MDFHSYHRVTARKVHRCAQCGSEIAVGTKHRKCAQVWEGEFSSFREHEECFAAWNELNFSRDYRALDYWEGARFLCDDEHEPEDREWMRDKYPVVAHRLGWAEEFA